MDLPKDIDYNKYNSDSGMATSTWGHCAWDFLFISILGRYPIKLNYSNTEHLTIKESFKTLLTGLDNILPCIYCRNSFTKFLRQLPIENYLGGRIELMYWLYLMKHKVNEKLILQEMKCYLDEKQRLKTLYHSRAISKEEYYYTIDDSKNKTFVTVPTPSFEQVLDHYESYRAECVPTSRKCSIKNN